MSSMEVTILQLVFVLMIRLKRRVFEILKPGEKFLRSEFVKILGPVFLKSLVSRCGGTNLQVPQVPQGRLSFGCEDGFEGKGWAFSGAGGAERSETESEGSLHDLPNSLVGVGAANAVRDVDIAGACGARS